MTVMKNTFFLICLSFYVSGLFAQTPFKPSKRRKDYFGTEDNEIRQLSNIGLQLSVGPTFTIASSNKLKSETVLTDNSGNEIKSEINQKGKIGGNVEIGFAHYNMKKPKFSFGRLIDYFDYGVGFKYFMGTENSKYFSQDALGRENELKSPEGKMENGYLSIRFSAHKLYYIKNSNLYLDNSLGTHLDYLCLKNAKMYEYMNPINQYFSKSLSVNLNYGFGVGMRIKRGSYLTTQAYIPILAFEEFRKESIFWFSSKYYPIICQIKWTYLLSKKKTACPSNGTEEDRKRNQEYMQNR